MRDRASVNSVAVRMLKSVFPKFSDIGCFSHIIDHVGERFNTPVFNDFMKTWIGIFSRSPKSRLAWQIKTGLKPPSYSPTRWWSKWYFDPAKINELQPSAGDLNDLQVLPFFSSTIIADLRFKEGTYLAAANGTSVDACRQVGMVEESSSSATILVYWLSGHSFTSTFFCSC